MQDKAFLPFTEEMKGEYTILVPNMLPMHFKLVIAIMKTHGYNMELLETSGQEIVEAGLKYTHNDACYPATLVIGQFMEALLSGRYDTEKTALIMFQTGGGCRASNYISLIRKAVKKAGLSHVPVISVNLAGLEKHPGFTLTYRMIYSVISAGLYGDLLMSLMNQVRPYEINKGEAEELAERWTAKLGEELGSGEKPSYSHTKQNYNHIIADFARIPTERRKTVKVGIVGEIFVKYSPLGNNDLERFLIEEGAEVLVPGLVDFFLYTLYNSLMEYRLYGRKPLRHPLLFLAYRFLCRKRQDVSDLIAQSGVFAPWTPFDEVAKMAEDYISTGVKMGEGWLLTAEMIELIDSGCKNIVCTQPFGCLPNHICGKGMMKPVMEKNPAVNIVAIDYDAGASRVNQENRLKLMLFTARRNLQREDEEELTS